MSRGVCTSLCKATKPVDSRLETIPPGLSAAADQGDWRMLEKACRYTGRSLKGPSHTRKKQSRGNIYCATRCTKIIVARRIHSNSNTTATVLGKFTGANLDTQSVSIFLPCNKHYLIFLVEILLGEMSNISLRGRPGQTLLKSVTGTWIRPV